LVVVDKFSKPTHFLTLTQPFVVILVVVDKFSKPTHFLTLTQPFVVKGVIEKFMEWIIKLYGLPKSIIRRFWKEVFQMLGTKLQLSSAYHPQTND
jgi:hypothetical protein